ncbi:MAG: lamin tail domain-containing protein [Myxococcota bacterium]
MKYASLLKGGAVAALVAWSGACSSTEDFVGGGDGATTSRSKNPNGDVTTMGDPTGGSGEDDDPGGGAANPPGGNPAGGGPPGGDPPGGDGGGTAGGEGGGTPTTGVCGDGTRDADEECDDGGNDNGDGCSNACVVELGYACDGETPNVCRLVPAAAGDLIITELMKDPNLVADANGEWVELHNPTSDELDLYGLTLSDRGSDSYLIDDHVVIAPGGYVVLGPDDDPTTNGGVVVDYAYTYSDFMLANGDDEVQVLNGNTVIDILAYTDADYPDAPGTSMTLDSGQYGHLTNDNDTSWCAGVAPYPTPTGTQFGTPRAANPSCNTGGSNVPAGWLCPEAWYSDSDCDCGCGEADPACMNANVGSCDFCTACGSCSLVNPTNNAVCTWTCDPGFYGTADGCDCGCGVVDPDCTDATVASCDFCDACGTCGDVEPANNAACLP